MLMGKELQRNVIRVPTFNGGEQCIIVSCKKLLYIISKYTIYKERENIYNI